MVCAHCWFSLLVRARSELEEAGGEKGGMAPLPSIWDSQICVVTPGPSTCAMFAHKHSQPALAKYLGPESVRYRGGKCEACGWGRQEECDRIGLDQSWLFCRLCPERGGVLPRCSDPP